MPMSKGKVENVSLKPSYRPLQDTKTQVTKNTS